MADQHDHVLAKPVELCCLRGDFHHGEATGSIIQIDGIDTYKAIPDPKLANGNVLLFFPDAFGLHLRSQLTMDAYAACGYLALGVDYFLGVRGWTESFVIEGRVNADVLISHLAGCRNKVLRDTIERPQL